MRNMQPIITQILTDPSTCRSIPLDGYTIAELEALLVLFDQSVPGQHPAAASFALFRLRVEQQLIRLRRPLFWRWWR